MAGKVTLNEVKQICDGLASFKDGDTDKYLSDLEILHSYPFQKADIPATKILIRLRNVIKQSTNSAIKKKADDVLQYVKDCSSNVIQPPTRTISEGQREKFQKRINDIFLKDNVEASKAKILSASITDEIFSCPDPSKVYQSLISALGKKELNFIQKLAEGSLMPEEFVKLPPDQLLSKQEKEKEKEIQSEVISKTSVPKPIPTKSALFRCPVCKSNNVSSYQYQTRSADEPMTNFCECLDCGKSWRQY